MRQKGGRGEEEGRERDEEGRQKGEREEEEVYVRKRCIQTENVKRK